MKAKNKTTLDLTTGSVTKKLLAFTLPILASNLLQHLYNAADKAVVGKFAVNGDLALAATGAPMVLCGTHALIQGSVELPAAALIVVDEQHRFGVAQRAALNQKSDRGHLLAMSATPIPRTLTLILYGDLDVSVLDELPPGRTPVKTRVVPESKREAMYGFLREEVAKGRQG